MEFIGRTRGARRAYSFDEIALAPASTTVDPQDVDLSWSVGAHRFALPFMAAAMDSVVDPAIAIQMSEAGGLAVLNLEGIQTRYDDPTQPLERIAAAAPDEVVGVLQQLYQEPIKDQLVTARIRAIVDTLGSVPGNLTLKLGDVYSGIDEREVDRVLLDLAEPWQAVPHVKAALRPGGIVFAHCPNVSQVQRFFDCLREVRGFGMLEAFELLQRGWTVRGRSMRPSHRMVAHTGFLCFARRLAEDELFEPEGEGFR